MPEDATVDLESLWAHAIEGLTDSTVTPQQRAWLRTTALPTALDTTKPARAVEANAGSSISR